MNKARRARLQKVRDAIEAVKADLEAIRDDEQEAADSLESAGLGDTERGQLIGENASDLDDAAAECDSLVGTLDEVLAR